MSDGMSDSSALCDIADEIDRAAYDLKVAIRRAEDGHRGLSVSVLAIVNEVLKDTDYRLFKNRD